MHVMHGLHCEIQFVLMFTCKPIFYRLANTESASGICFERCLTVSKLSKLQKRILEEGLRARWDEPIHRAWQRSEPGSFDTRFILVVLLRR